MIFNLVQAVIIPMATGYVLISLLFRSERFSMPLKLSLSLGSGMGILTQWMLFIGILKLPFNYLTLNLPLLTFSILTFIYLLISGNKSTDSAIVPRISSPMGSGRLLKILLWIYIALNIYYVLWRALNVPISEWDSISTIAFKAKIIFYEGSLPSLDLLPHKTYPLCVPFIESWVAFNLGQWDDQLVKIFYPLFFLSFLYIFYYFLGLFADTQWALIGSALLLSSNLLVYHATISYRDFFLMYYNCITIILLLLWNQYKKPSFLLLASFFAGFASSIKLEGTAFILIYITILLLMHLNQKKQVVQKIKNTLVFLLPALVMTLTYHLYKIFNNVLSEGRGIVDKTKIDFTIEKLKLIPSIFKSFTYDLFLTVNWGWVWVVMFVSFLYLPKVWKDMPIRILFQCLMLFFGLYFTTALLTTNYIWIGGNLSLTTLSRLILHFYPLSVALLILISFRIFSLGDEKPSL